MPNIIFIKAKKWNSHKNKKEKILRLWFYQSENIVKW
jgi:hypothetical protein